MSESVNALSSEAGVTEDQAHQGLGAVLKFLRDELGGDLFAKIEAAVPGASQALGRYESAAGASKPGLLGTVVGLAGQVLGGKAGELSKLLESFTKLGFNAEQIEEFLPRAIEFLKGALPPELLALVAEKLPALQKYLGAPGGASSSASPSTSTQ